GNEIPAQATSCPHCGRPSLFPNVRAASLPEEVAALAERFAAARTDVEARGCGAVADAFMQRIDRSKPVIMRPFSEVERLARNDHQIFSTYYRQVEAEIRLPHTSAWDPIRRLADEALFPGYKENIRFAALTLNDRGLPHYGDCFLILRPTMIAHRTSVFEENSVVFMKRRDLELRDMMNIVPGYRAPWADRAKLCLAKLGSALQPDTTEADFSSLLLRSGKTPQEDDFVEVHVWGPITIRTVEKVVLVKPLMGRAAKAMLRVWGERLSQYGVTLEVT
ncbi:MAG: hypothetical protein KC492_09485, partial [Myxococcales bacterium]|nr:hypothetical protein [Myxococcales bacterium]